MAAERSKPLPRTTVIKLASVLSLEDNAFIVGGQALNLWAERYSPGRPELISFGPFTSKDLDYFGHRVAAEKLAAALGGQVHIPGPDDHTPNSAVVSATVDGIAIEIDFLSDIIGVGAKALTHDAVELIVPIRGDGVDVLEIPVMHPLHCLQSRVANVVSLGRRDDVALRQLAAAPIVLQAYIDEMLETGDVREAGAVLQKLFAYLRSDIAARQCPDLPMRDPVDILATFQRDKRLALSFRWFNLRSMRRKLATKRRRRLGV